jgi:hypothetical protein
MACCGSETVEGRDQDAGTLFQAISPSRLAGIGCGGSVGEFPARSMMRQPDILRAPANGDAAITQGRREARAGVSYYLRGPYFCTSRRLIDRTGAPDQPVGAMIWCGRLPVVFRATWHHLTDI